MINEFRECICPLTKCGVASKEEVFGCLTGLFGSRLNEEIIKFVMTYEKR